MLTFLPALAAAFAAICIWFAFRIGRQWGPRTKWVIAAVVGVLAISVGCLRYDGFASPTAPPWRGPYWPLYPDAPALQNTPIVVGSQQSETGLLVTVANRGETTLEYAPALSTLMDIYIEVEERGQWQPAGMAALSIEDDAGHEIPPGAEVEWNVEFTEPRRERLLGCFSETGTNRKGLVVLAAEDRQVGVDLDRVMLMLTTGVAAFFLWLTLRIINRRERWAKRTLAALVGTLALYVLSIGPACWVSSRTKTGEEVLSAVYRPLTWGLSRNEQGDRILSWYSRLWAAKDWSWVDGNWKFDNWLYSPKARSINRNLGVD